MVVQESTFTLWNSTQKNRNRQEPLILSLSVQPLQAETLFTMRSKSETAETKFNTQATKPS